MKIVKRLVILLFILLGLAAGWIILFGEETQPLYKTNTIGRGTIANIVTANGTLNPLELVNVGTQISGKISALYVDVNDEVKADQLLAEIDPSILNAQLKQSQNSLETSRTALEQAQRDLNRTRELAQKEYLPKVDLERAEQSYRVAYNSYESAKTGVERDKVNLSYAKITSPIDGIVISKEVTLGQTVAANFQTPNLFKIAGDLTKMKIDVSFSESDISRVKQGMPVTFTVDSFPDQPFSGVIETVNLNPVTQLGIVTYSVTVMVDNPDKVLLPGMTAYISVTLSEKKDVLRVPGAALRFNLVPEKPSGMQRLLSQVGLNPPLEISPPKKGRASKGTGTLYLLKDGHITMVEVKTGATDDMYVEVSGEGIAEGDTVITGLNSQKK